MTEPVDQHIITEYGLVMPFVAVQSKGGPFQDQAYAAGWEMGALHGRLAQLTPEAGEQHHAQMIRIENREQADLIAMHTQCTAAFTPSGDGWLLASFKRQE